jgi:biotin-[acetyl-CoA-carboxylase] ligase BirA-like protein
MATPHREQQQLAEQLGAGVSVLHLPQVGSTSTRLKELIVAGQVTGPTVLVTSHQTSGRGTRSRSWTSTAPDRAGSIQRARDLALTFAAPVSAALDPRLSLAIGAMLAEAIERCTRVSIRVKWPNDLCAGEPPRKLGGVLLETTHGWILVGVGVNVNSKPADFPADIAPQLTTLSHEHRAPCDVNMLQVAIVRALRQLPDVELDTWMQRFHERDCTGGTRYTFNTGSRQLLVTAESVCDDGALLLRDAHGNEHRVAAFTDLERA